MRLTCSSLSLHSSTAASAIDTVGALGFPAMDLVGIPTFPHPHLDIARRDPAELNLLAVCAKKANVEVANVVTVPTDGMNAWDAPEVRARVDWAVRACAALGAPRLILDAGNPIANDPVERSRGIERWKTMVDAAVELASRGGVELAIEMPHTGTLAERYDQVAELMSALPNDTIGIDYDTSHVFRSGTGLEDSWRQMGRRVVKVSLRDVDANREFCRPGLGLVDFNRLFQHLARAGFEGDVVLELETPGVEAPEDQRHEVELARAYVEGLTHFR